MKVEVEVIYEFFDFAYGKERKVGDKFICNKELALKRKHFCYKDQYIPLNKILRDVPNDTPEDTKETNKYLDMIKNRGKEF